MKLKYTPEVYKLSKKHGVRVMFDCTRYVENAYFIKEREEEYNYIKHSVEQVEYLGNNLQEGLNIYNINN